MIGKVIGGLSGIASGMIGSGKRKREQKLIMKTQILAMFMLIWRILWKT